MVEYIIKRLLWMIPVLLGVSVLIFTILFFTPGDPASIILGGRASQAEKEALTEQMGLNDPYIVQLGSFLENTFLKFDFGTSFITKQSVAKEILNRLPYTLLICYVGIFVGVFFGMLLGIIAALNQNTWKDNAAMVVSMVGVSMPNFWFALIMVMLFSMKFGWLPVTGVTNWKGFVIPCLSIAVGSLSMISRLTRSCMLEVIRQDYITTAKAKGQIPYMILIKHALRNAVLPIITMVGGLMAGSLGGTVVVETIFSIPGLGSYLITGISNRDYPTIQGSVIILAFVFALMSLIVDLLYTAVNPKLRNSFVMHINKKTKERTISV